MTRPSTEVTLTPFLFPLPGRSPLPKPPLQFYLKVIGSREWSDISVLTYVQAESEVNPAFAALDMLKQTGALGPRFHTHKVSISSMYVVPMAYDTYIGFTC